MHKVGAKAKLFANTLEKQRLLKSVFNVTRITEISRILCLNKSTIYTSWQILHQNLKIFPTKANSKKNKKSTARELLFDGYGDTLLSMADMMAKEGDRPMDKFAWFYKVIATSLKHV